LDLRCGHDLAVHVPVHCSMLVGHKVVPFTFAGVNDGGGGVRREECSVGEEWAQWGYTGILLLCGVLQCSWPPYDMLLPTHPPFMTSHRVPPFPGLGKTTHPSVCHTDETRVPPTSPPHTPEACSFLPGPSTPMPMWVAVLVSLPLLWRNTRDNQFQRRCSF
jgi:hypothetical protein